MNHLVSLSSLCVRRLCYTFCLLCLFLITACGATVDGSKKIDSGHIPDTPPQKTEPADPSGNSATRAPDAGESGTATAPGQPGDDGKKKPTEVTPKKTSKKFSLTPAKSIDLNGEVPACWLPLVERLQSDNMGDPIYAAYFNGLADYSAEPMGVKVKELFTNAFLRKKSTTPSATTQPKTNPKARIYKKIVTAATMERCTNFLNEHEKAFAAVEEKYAVPKEIIAALLYLETRHGDYLGKANAFWSLACMAAASEPEMVSDGIADLPITEEHQEWLQAKLSDKSGWAYKELKALLVYCNANEIDPREVPGSVYGAIGMCQFMPSNLIPYGDDGDGDGRIDLFSPDDAIFSVAKYLTGHGWKTTSTVDQQRTILRRYNNLTTYANTILTLAESVRTGELQSAPPDIPTKETKTAEQTASMASGTTNSTLPAGTNSTAAPAASNSTAPAASNSTAPAPQAPAASAN